MRSALEHEGYFVISAPNGRDALDLLRKMTPPSMVLLDINMPLMNGEEFLKTFRKQPQWASIPVAQISGEQDKSLPGTCYSFKKPLDLSKLLDAIKACLTGQNS